MDFGKYRNEFPVTRKLNYLATGAEGPLSTRVIKACEAYFEETALEGGISPIVSEKSKEQMSESKRLFATMVNCDTNEVALVPSLSYGINMAALMINPKKGDNIVVNDLEFDSNMYPWLRYSEKGVEIRVAKSVNGMLPIEEIEKHVDDKTKVITASHISSWSGSRQDLKALARLAHSRGAMVAVDAANSVGAIATDLRESEVDFFTVSGHKWLLGPKGSGFLFVNRKIIGKFEPPLPGWYGVPTRTSVTAWRDIAFSDSASKFEVGTPALVSYVGVTASMKMLFEVGVSRVYKRISDLSQYAIENLNAAGLKIVTPSKRDMRGGGVVVRLDPTVNGADVHRKLLAKRIMTLLIRTGDIEVYPGFFNTEEEVDSLVKALRSP